MYTNTFKFTVYTFLRTYVRTLAVAYQRTYIHVHPHAHTYIHTQLFSLLGRRVQVERGPLACTELKFEGRAAVCAQKHLLSALAQKSAKLYRGRHPSPLNTRDGSSIRKEARTLAYAFTRTPNGRCNRQENKHPKSRLPNGRNDATS